MARTLAANSCCTFLMGGPGRHPREIKGRDGGKVYEAAFANLNVNLSILSSKTECSWRNSWPCPVCGGPASLPSSLPLSLSVSLYLQQLGVLTASVVSSDPQLLRPQQKRCERRKTFRRGRTLIYFMCCDEVSDVPASVLPPSNNKGLKTSQF